MKINLYIKTYKDKILLLPREEVAWEKTNKIFMIKLGWLIWDLRLSFNFQIMEDNTYQGHCDFNKPKDPEYIKPVSDWSGCQGTCDFEESFNTTGWIQI